MCERIQRKRVKGWRMPEGAVYVGRPSQWGNPYRVHDAAAGGWKVQGRGQTWWGDVEPMTKAEAVALAAELYRRVVPVGSVRARDVEIQLAGRDLVCWCPLDAPCHADVLLELAAPSPAVGGPKEDG